MGHTVVLPRQWDIQWCCLGNWKYTWLMNLGRVSPVMFCTSWLTLSTALTILAWSGEEIKRDYTLRKRRNRGERREKKERREEREKRGEREERRKRGERGRSRRRGWRGEEEKGTRDYNLVHMHTTSSPMDLWRSLTLASNESYSAQRNLVNQSMLFSLLHSSSLS